MGHQFTVEGEEAVALAEELAALTGESLGTAVTAALRERLKKERERRSELQAILTMAVEFRALLGDDAASSDHSWLYDEHTGLPV